MFDAKKAVETAEQEVAEEQAKKAIEALKRKYRELDSAQKVLVNIQREIADLEVSIGNGSFTS